MNLMEIALHALPFAFLALLWCLDVPGTISACGSISDEERHPYHNS